MKHLIPEDDTDYILWQKFKKGDTQALSRIYNSYYPPLLVYGLKIRYDPDFIKDCIQEMFCDIMSHIKNLGDTEHILPYLITSLRRKILRKIQYELSFRHGQCSYLQNLQVSDAASHEMQVHLGGNPTRKKLLRDMVNDLPTRQKEALLMKFYLDLDYEDISQVMGLNIQSVRNLVHRAIKALREKVNFTSLIKQLEMVDK